MSRENEKDLEKDQGAGERELAGLAQILRENRPAPEPEFVERLDRAVADHFPPEWVEDAPGEHRHRRPGSPGERFRRWLAGNRTMIPAFAGAVGMLFIVAVVVVNANSGPDFGNDTGSTDTTQSAAEGSGTGAMSSAASADLATPAGVAPIQAKAKPESGESTADSAAGQPDGGIELEGRERAGSGSMAGSRDVAREAEITLGTDPDGVQDAANKVVEVTDDHNGIVMDSKVTDGEEGAAGASFSLLIPSGQIESAVADLSGIADLRSRSQELTDITAPTTRTEDKIADSKAKIKSLLGELEETYDEDERARIEQKIRWERNDLSYYETRLNRLQRRVEYTPVSLQVETGGDSASDDESPGWGLGDAIDDAGNLLGVAAGVTVLALAVAIPIGIVVLIALALNRAWVRHSRRRVLADD